MGAGFCDDMLQDMHTNKTIGLLWQTRNPVIANGIILIEQHFTRLPPSSATSGAKA